MTESRPYNLYFIALVPPEDIASEVTEVKKYFQKKFNSKAALRSPPHITLHMPFRWKPSKEKHLIDFLSAFAADRIPFHVELEGYGAFEPKVIYVNVVPSESLVLLSEDLTKAIKKELKIVGNQSHERPFRPHMTVAFRDLKKQNFKTAWEEFRTTDYSASFQVGDIALLIHTGKVWNIHCRFPLNVSS
jgi:2'-5' RNA ligase